MQADTNKLKRYLLGDLPDREAEAMDIQIITDPDLCEEISLAESDLMEDFLEGGLSAGDEQLFRSNFMTSEVRREQLREIELLKKVGQAQAAQKKPDLMPVEERSRFLDLLKTYLRPLAIGGAVVALLIIGLYGFGYFGGSLSPLEKQFTELNAKDLSNPSELATYSNVNLIQGNLRGSDLAGRQSEDKLTDTVLFRLTLPSKAEGSTYKAKVLRGSTLIFTVVSAKVYQNGGGQDVRLLLPKSILQKGQYQIKLESPSGAEAGTFAFVIE